MLSLDNNNENVYRSAITALFAYAAHIVAEVIGVRRGGRNGIDDISDLQGIGTVRSGLVGSPVIHP